MENKRQREGGWKERAKWVKRSGMQTESKRKNSVNENDKKHTVIYEVLWPFHSFFLSLSLLPLSKGLLVEF